MPWSQRSLSALYAIGLALFALSCVAGVVYALTQERAVPPVKLDYTTHVERLLEEGRRREALDQMVHASLIETNRLPVFQTIVRIAVALEDVERARFGARAWAELDAMDPEAHAALCSSLLAGLDVEGVDARGIDLQELARVEEVMDHAKVLIVLEPGSPRGYRCLGRAFILRGTHNGASDDLSQGVDWLTRALRIDPELDDVRPWLRYARSKDRQ